IGVETGDDKALTFMNKGYTSKDILIQCKKLEEANIDYNIFYLTGIYGNGSSTIGVENTVKIFNQLHPKIIGASMLTVFKTSQLYEEIQLGNWQEESEFEKLRELRMLIEKLSINTHFAALGSSNAFNFQGKLPSEKQKLIDYIDSILNNYTESQLKSYRNNLNSL
ncbi:MAG: radical SAM protein, partial [Eubacterium sp.]|nr:radical SAM protein [Eubacterium sp.]